MTSNAEKEYLSKVAGIGCIACEIQGTPGSPAEIHHLREGQGISMDTSASMTHTINLRGRSR